MLRRRRRWRGGDAGPALSVSRPWLLLRRGISCRRAATGMDNAAITAYAAHRHLAAGRRDGPGLAASPAPAWHPGVDRLLLENLATGSRRRAPRSGWLIWTRLHRFACQEGGDGGARRTIRGCRRRAAYPADPPAPAGAGGYDVVVADGRGCAAQVDLAAVLYWVSLDVMNADAGRFPRAQYLRQPRDVPVAADGPRARATRR